MKKTASWRALSAATTSTPSRSGRAKIICQRFVRFSNFAGAGSPVDNERTMSIFIAQQNFHEIAPPVDYSFVPAWAIFLASFVGLSLIGLIVWLLKRKPKPPLPPKLPRQIALEELDRIGSENKTMKPYQFSIRVSAILRRYVTNQFALPVTRQTSVEFLTTLAKSSSFSMNEKSLLEDYLIRCDLIKFARYEATSADSRLLLDEATRFVKGEQLAFA